MDTRIPCLGDTDPRKSGRLTEARSKRLPERGGPVSTR
jgi:hypothetical protein